MKFKVTDRLGYNAFIEERTCPVCGFPGALAIVDPVSEETTHEDYFVARCPCSTVFESNDTGRRVLAKRTENADSSWWLNEKKGEK